MTIESSRYFSAIRNLAISMALSSAWLVCSTAEARVVGVDVEGNYWAAEPNTGIGTILGHTGLTGLQSMAADESATLYTADATSLYTLDFDNGQSTLVTPITLGNDAIAIHAMAFAPNGTLYAANIPSVGSASDLWTIDLNTGVGTFIGSVEESISAMDFQGETMFGYAEGATAPGPGLGTIDMETAVFTDLDPIEQSIGITGITFKAPLVPGAGAPRCCELFAASDILYGMDPVSGEAVAIGLIDPKNRSVLTGTEAFFVVPEPATSTFVVWFALGGLILRRLRN